MPDRAGDDAQQSRETARAADANGANAKHARRDKLPWAQRWGLWVDEDFEHQRRKAHERAAKQPLLLSRGGLADTAGDHLSKTVEFVREVERTELERETNLNTRAATVAAVAALIVSVSGAVGKSIFEGGATTTSGAPAATLTGDARRAAMGSSESAWTDGWRDATLTLFLGGLAFVAAAMAMAVLAVLRPGRTPRPKHFFTETLANLWLRGYAVEIASVETTKLNLLYLDRSLRTLPEWHVRNRSKARWLRRSWVILAIGVGLIGFAGVLVVSREARGWELEYSALVLFVGFFFVWVLLHTDWVGAFTQEAQAVDLHKDRQADEVKEVGLANEIDTIAKLICRRPS